MMTRKQKNVIERLYQDILKQDGHGSEYEYKKFHTEVIDGCDHVFLTTIVGMKGDEGTLASVFGRKRRLLMIGPKGGVRSLIGKKVQGYERVLAYGYEL